jgi:hypothetical protein
LGAVSGRRFAGLSILGVSGILLGAGLLARGFVAHGVSQDTLWRLKLGLLLALEAVYGFALAATLLLTPALALRFVAARRRKSVSPALARGCLLGCSLLLAMVLAEAGAWVWRGRLERAGLLALAAPTPGQSSNSERALEPGGNAAHIVLPTRFAQPTDDVLTLVVVGESSAQGVPFNLYALSAANLVRWQLAELLPGRRVQLVNLAASGETLERQHQKLAALRYRPDVLIVYCGHNEFSSRIPWSRDVPHYADEEERSAGQALVATLERLSPFCGLIRRVADTCRVAIPPPRGGYRALVDKPAYTAAEFDRLLADFRQRLERIVAYAEGLGAVPILIIPPANDSDFEPNRSFLPSPTPRAEREAFAREFSAARRLEATDPDRAIAQYRALLARQPGFAEVHFRLARLLEARGLWDEAYRHAIAARDSDGLPMRCPSGFQDAYREVAARHRVVLIDGQALFHVIGRHGLLDDGLFMDAMHPSLRGQIALAQVILQGLCARRALGWPDSTPAPVLDPARCAAHFGLGPEAWKKLCDWGAVVYDLLASGCHDQAERLARRRAYEDASRRIARGEAPDAVGLPNVGTPAPVPVVPEAVILTEYPGAFR